MAAAADWANSLRITSGSFQVAEIAPAMRKTFEKEVHRRDCFGDFCSSVQIATHTKHDEACEALIFR